jgi:signal transduction histidine kinase
VQNLRVAVFRETDRLKTEFFANISHEFRTPLTLTLGPLQRILGGRLGQVTPAIKAELEVMLRNQDRLLELINQILVAQARRARCAWRVRGGRWVT